LEVHISAILVLPFNEFGYYTVCFSVQEYSW